MHDYILGFVCFMAGALVVVIVGIPMLEGQSDDPPPPAREATDTTPVASRPWSRHEPDPHPAWPECDCPSEAFHTKYYPSADVR
jgi:hypothetical protein